MLRERGIHMEIIYQLHLGYYGGLLIVFLISTAFVIALRAWFVDFLIIGFFFGVLVRDIGWSRALKKAWQFNEKITDWKVVQQLADGETVD